MRNIGTCDSTVNRERDKFSWILFSKQLLICSGVYTCYFMFGLCTGAPTVFIPQIRREANSSEAVSYEMASWLPATLNYCGLPWVFVLPSVVAFIGRKRTFIIVCTSTLVAFLVFYFSVTVTHILISEIMQGIGSASFLTIFTMILTEYTSAKYRGLFLTLKAASFFWGVLVSNTIGTFSHWRNIPLIGLLCTVYSLLTVSFWPESPYWLASKGRFDECSAAHRWLKGSDTESEEELERLMKTYHYVSNDLCKQEPLRDRFRLLLKTMSRRTFYKPVLLAILLSSSFMFSGKLVYTVYALDIIEKITENESAAYTGMLVLDGVTVFSMYIGCFVCKLLKRRTMLMCCSSISITFLFLISIYLYLIKLSIITEDRYIPVFLLSGFSISISCGPTILSTSISGELLPLESRSMSVFIIALTFQLMSGSILKLSPYCFILLGLHGTFCFFAVVSLICLILIYMYLPETKDKTLQEIGDCMKRNQKLQAVEEATKLMPVLTNK